MTGGRERLKLREDSPANAEPEPSVVLGEYDVLLPCRAFRIEFKSAEVGKVSITAEFLLRLLKLVGPMPEEAVAGYFGYNQREMAFVLGEVVTADLVSRVNGTLSLTTTGLGTFRPGSEEPAIYEIVQKGSVYGFDLIAIAPEEQYRPTFFESRLPELPILNESRASDATQAVRTSFRQNYSDIVKDRDPLRKFQRSLYSIDAIEPRSRFLTPVRLSVTAKASTPYDAEADLTDWRPDYELSDRQEIIGAADRFVASLSTTRRSDDIEAYDALVEVAPELFKGYATRNGLAVDRFYRHALMRAGEVRADRPTVPLVGSLFTHDNAQRLVDVAGYGLRQLKFTPESIYWLSPVAEKWAATTTLVGLIAHFKSQLVERNQQNGLTKSRPQTILLSQGKPSPWTENAFDVCRPSDVQTFPKGLEVLVIPGVLAALMVHAPIGSAAGHAVPLGFASFDVTVIDRTLAKLDDAAGLFKLTDNQRRDLLSAQTSGEVEVESEGGV